MKKKFIIKKLEHYLSSQLDINKNLKCLSFFMLLSIASLSYAEQNSVSGTIIKFTESEAGIGTTPVTMTITERYLRIDDAIQADGSLSAEGSLSAKGSSPAEGSTQDTGFVLYDRKEKVIYSVSSEEQQIVKIKIVPVTIPSPIELKIRSVTLPMDNDTPLIAGKKTQHKQIFVNDKLCYNLISVPGLMPDSVSAMGDFNQVLAGQQAETLRYIPADLHEACDLARHTFYPKMHLDNGFPMMFQMIDETGKIGSVKYSRALTNFKQQSVSKLLFILPEYPIVPIN